MVLDACRDNPLPRRGARSIGGTRGLSEPTAPNGQMVIAVPVMKPTTFVVAVFWVAVAVSCPPVPV